MTDDDRDFDRQMLARVRERLANPDLGNEAFTRLSNEARQLSKRLAKKGAVSAPVVSVDDARAAFVARFGEVVTPEVFADLYGRAVESGWPREWWERHGASPVAVLAYRRSAFLEQRAARRAESVSNGS